MQSVRQPSLKGQDERRKTLSSVDCWLLLFVDLFDAISSSTCQANALRCKYALSELGPLAVNAPESVSREKREQVGLWVFMPHQ